MSTAKSIPPPADAGKDPPTASKLPPKDTESQLEPNGTKDEDGGKDKDKKNMPPPPRPKITTQAAGSSNILNLSSQPSYTQPPAQPSLSPHPSLQPSLHHSVEIDQERERPAFTPFFTLIDDVTLSGEGEENTHHPSRIHYIFSDDDDTSLLTSALIRSMDGNGGEEVEEEGRMEESTSKREHISGSSSSSATFPNHQKSKAKPAQKVPEKKQRREERVVIVDINDAGTGIERISSLSKEWQVLSADIASAPTWDGARESDSPGGNERGLMLRIEGTSVSTLNDTGEKKTGGVGLGIDKGKGREGLKGSVTDSGRLRGSGIGEEEMMALLEGFDRKMGVLRRVVEGGREDGRRRSEERERDEGRMLS